MNILRTDSDHKDFKALVKLLDADLAVRDGGEFAFYDQFNQIDNLKYVIVAFDGDTAVGCGAIKAFDDTSMEVKRMFTLPEQRGKGIASALLTELEKWARELNYKTCVLETGLRQPEAIGLYKKNGYVQIPNYGQYLGVENSVCFQKELK